MPQPSAPQSAPVSMPAPLVSPDWLAAHLEAPDLRVVDATWIMPALGRDAQAEHLKAHIPGAVFFDIDAIADRATPKPHALPPVEVFAEGCAALGLGSDQRVVVYDQHAGASAAARVWWLFRVFGQEAVAVLDGGFGAWKAAGLPVEAGPVVADPRPFHPRVRPDLVWDAARVGAAVAAREARAPGGEDLAHQIVDARSAGRWAATEPEPWDVPRVGRIPGSFNLPFPELLSGPDGAMAAPDAIRARFAQAGVDLERPMVASCGSGVTACVLALAAHVAGKTDVAVYDGSWWEYSRTSFPVAP